MPARRPPGPRIKMAPMRCVERDFAAAARLAVGSMETMSPPKLRFLAARIDLTFMAASLARMIIFWIAHAREHTSRPTREHGRVYPTILPRRRFRQDETV